MLKRLIVNADDFGLTPGVNQGIIEACKAGIVTSTSVMINMPYAEEGISLAQKETPSLGLGLHVNLSAGRPVLPAQEIPDLVDGETFHSLERWYGKFTDADADQAEAEIMAQIRRFIQLAGSKPDHLDSHHHLAYLNPRFAGIFIEAAAELDIPVRNPYSIINSSGRADSSETYNSVFELDNIAALIETAEKAFWNELSKTGVKTTDYFIVDFYGKNAILADLLLLLLAVPEGYTELMCHPGLADDLLMQVSGYTIKRQDERDALMHSSTREVINSQFIQLSTFKDIR